MFRVLALGDSFVEGYTVNSHQTVSQRLEVRLKEAGSGARAEVINGGTSGYSTGQEYLFYRTEGVRYRPSLVLLFFFWNDVLYTDRQDYFLTPTPVFEMSGGDLRLHRYPVKEKPKATSQPAETPSDDPQGSALLEMVRERLWVGWPAAHDAVAGLGLWNPMPKATPRLEMLVYDQRDLATVEDAWEKVEAVVKAHLRSALERARTRCRVRRRLGLDEDLKAPAHDVRGAQPLQASSAAVWSPHDEIRSTDKGPAPLRKPEGHR